MVVACQMIFSVPSHIEAAKMWFLGSKTRNQKCFERKIQTLVINVIGYIFCILKFKKQKKNVGTFYIPEIFASKLIMPQCVDKAEVQSWVLQQDQISSI